MKIGLISDTHLFPASKPLPSIVFRTFEPCDMILHAGDILCFDVLDSLSKVSKTIAVAGNNDPDELQSLLGLKHIIQVNGKRICLTHGHDGYGSAVQNIKRLAAKTDADIFVFGHSHEPIHVQENGIHFINPGSAVQRRRQPFCSVALLDIGEIVKVEFVCF